MNENWARQAIQMVALLALAWAVTPAMAADTYSLRLNDSLRSGELDLAVGKTKLISSPAHLKQITIGNPDVADVKLLNSKKVMIQGKRAGHTNLAFRDRNMELIALLDVVVGHDIEAIKHKIHQVLPNEPGIEVRSANANVILSGEVSNALAMDTALVVARSFAPQNVTNLLQVGGGQQVMLEVRIAEVERNSLKKLGIQGTLNGSVGRVGLNAAANAAVTGAFGTVGMVYRGLDFKLSALETQGLARVLAEPNLVALSGQEGSFLVGGEFPIVTVTTVGQPTVEYKEFGVGLKFTPLVLNSSKINLGMQAEVSAIDTTQTAVGSNYPVLKARRTSTTVEVADGQSFAIAGLIQSDINNAINKYPGLGEIPILGALFRSTDFQRQETELVVVITPRLVRPVTEDVLELPTDNFTPTSDVDQYLTGRLQGPKQEKNKSQPADGAADPAAKGVDGAYGHQL